MKLSSILLNLANFATRIKQLEYDLGLIADYVIEQGTSGDWTFRKWNSGVAEGWYKKTFTNVDISTTWGTLKEGKITDSIIYPTGLFVDVPTITCTFTSAVFVEFNSAGTASGTGPLYGVRPNTLSTAIVPVHLYVKGLWKNMGG